MMGYVRYVRYSMRIIGRTCCCFAVDIIHRRPCHALSFVDDDRLCCIAELGVHIIMRVCYVCGLTIMLYVLLRFL
jgi:hypothetical protein